jgi:AraC-like DNA-binding protein
MLHAKFLWRERQSDSRFIESVWTCTANSATSRTSIADPCISITLIKEKATARVTIMGPRTSPQNIPLASGYTCTTIRLKTGVSLKSFSTRKLMNTPFTVPADSQSRFQLERNYLRFPDFDHVESLVDHLYELGILEYNPANGDLPANLSSRTYARQTKHATGLSPYRLYQLKRIHQALRLLKQGIPAAKVAAELAFVDQSHLVHASKQFFGHTPKDLPNLPQTP